MSVDLHAAGLSVAMGELDEETLRLARPWLLAVVDEVPRLPPLGFVIDLGRALGGRRIPIGPPSSNDRLERALALYGEHVVARLANDPRLLSATDAVARLDRSERAGAVAACAHAVLSRIGQTLPPAEVASTRRLLRRPEPAILSAVREASCDPEARDVLAERLESLARAARAEGWLLHEADVFMLENLHTLRTPSRRLAFSHIAEVAAAVESRLPRRMRSQRDARGATPTQLHAESSYPTGGYSSIANHGSIENLVSTELAYMEDDAEVDPFDLRYATNELLRFTRDESLFVRRRRRLFFALGDDWVAGRVRDHEAPWQRLVLASGTLVACVRRLVGWLDEDDLEILVRFAPELEEERGHVAMLLREYVESGAVRFVQDAEGDDPLEVGETDRIEVCHDAREANGAVVLGRPDPPGLEGWARAARDALGSLV